MQGEDGSQNYKIINIKINHITKLSNTNPANNKLTVFAPGVNGTVKPMNYFRGAVKKDNSPVKRLELKINVWTAMKVKTCSIRTKADIAKLSAKSLKVGKHKVKAISKKKGIQVHQSQQDYCEKGEQYQVRYYEYL